MTVLWVSHVKITDPDRYGEYAKRATSAIGAHGRLFLARGGAYVQMKGPDRPRNVVARFPSLAATQDCYNSDAYQEVLQFAKGASEREHSIIEEIVWKGSLPK
jgi:uncharacterized protein (DUF1330 family)